MLPFADLGGKPEEVYFADGITEDLITDLAQIRGIFVIARNSVWGYRGEAAVDIPEVSDRLGVRYILEGSVRRQGDLVRINAQLVDGHDGHHLWADRYDGSLADVFALQDRVIAHIVAALAVTLPNPGTASVGEGGTSNPLAYDTLLRGRDALRRDTETDTLAAIALFEKATALDPDYGRAYASLAAAQWRVVLSFWSSTAGAGWQHAYEGLLDSLQAAKARPTALAYAISAQLLSQQGRYEEAFADVERAMVLAPGDADNHVAKAGLLNATGRAAEAEAEVRIAIRADPGFAPATLRTLAISLFNQGNFVEAAEILDRLTAQGSDVAVDYATLVSAYGHLGRLERVPELVARYDAIAIPAAYDPLTVQESAFDWYGVVFDYHRPYLLLMQAGLRKAGVPEGAGTDLALDDYATLIRRDLGEFSVKGATKLTAAKARALHARGVPFVDVRAHADFDSGHVPGAASLSLVVDLSRETLAPVAEPKTRWSSTAPASTARARPTPPPRPSPGATAAPTTSPAASRPGRTPAIRWKPPPGSSGDVRPVRRLVHQPVELGRIGQRHLEEPTVLHRILVDQCGVLHDRRVDLGDLPVERRRDVARRLHRLDRHHLVALDHRGALLGQLDEDEIPELLGRMLGDPHDHLVAVHLQPLVLLGVTQHPSLPQPLLYPGATSGSFATLTGSIFPRNCPESRVSGAACPIATYPMATGASRLGPNPPEVTTPTASSPAKISVPPRIGARPSGRSPTRRRDAPDAICPRITSAPGKPARPRAARPPRRLDRPLQRRLDRRRRPVDVAAVEAQPRLQPQRIARPEPHRHHPLRRQQPLRQRHRVLLRRARSRIRPRRYSPTATPPPARPPSSTARTSMKRIPATSGLSAPSTAAALGPCSAISPRSSGSTSQPASPAWRCARSSALQAAFTTSSRWSPRFATIRSSRIPPASSVNIAYRCRPGASPSDVHRHQRLQRPRRVRRAPPTSAAPRSAPCGSRRTAPPPPGCADAPS